MNLTSIAHHAHHTISSTFNNNLSTSTTVDTLRQNSLNDYVGTCFNMRKTTVYSKYIGPVVQMPYLLADEWHSDPSMQPIRFLMSFYCMLTFCVSFTAFMYKRHRMKEHRQSWMTVLNLWFNFSNAFIFCVMANFGWITNVFTVAAAHNALEFFMFLALCQKLFPDYDTVKSLVTNKVLNDIFYIIGFVSVLPHLLIVDFELGAKIKGLGGISDLILCVVALLGLCKCVVNAV